MGRKVLSMLRHVRVPTTTWSEERLHEAVKRSLRLARSGSVSSGPRHKGDEAERVAVMSQCGVAACPADAATEIKQISDYISLYGGGRGCVRDIIEQVMRLQGKWFDPSVVNHEAMNW